MKDKLMQLIDERGMALIVTMLVLLVLTLAGMLSTGTATLEMQIAGNVRGYVDSFYKAEAALREVARGLERTPDPNLINNSNIILPNNVQISALTPIGNSNSPQAVLNARLNIVDNAQANVNATEPVLNAKVRVVHAGAAPGASMVIGTSHRRSVKHRFFIFSRHKNPNVIGRGVLLEAGYMKRLVP